MLRITWLLILFLITFSGFSQDCIQFLEDYYIDLTLNGAPSDGKTLFYEVEIETCYRDRDAKNSNVKLKAIISKDNFIYTSSLFSIYRDSIDMFYITNNNKTIIHAASDGDISQTGVELNSQVENVKNYRNIGDIFCSDTLIGREKYKYIEMIMFDEFRSAYSLEKINFYFNKRQKRFDCVRYYYTELNQMIWQEYRILTYNKDYNKKLDQIPARLYLFNLDGTLKDEYSDYQIIEKN